MNTTYIKTFRSKKKTCYTCISSIQFKGFIGIKAKASVYKHQDNLQQKICRNKTEKNKKQQKKHHKKYKLHLKKECLYSFNYFRCCSPVVRSMFVVINHISQLLRDLSFPTASPSGRAHLDPPASSPRCAATRWRHWSSCAPVFLRGGGGEPLLLFLAGPGAKKKKTVNKTRILRLHRAVLSTPPHCGAQSAAGLLAERDAVWLMMMMMMMMMRGSYSLHHIFGCFCAHEPCRCGYIPTWTNAAFMHTHARARTHTHAHTHSFAAAREPSPASRYNHRRAIYNSNTAPHWPRFHWSVKLCWCLYISPSFSHLSAPSIGLTSSFHFDSPSPPLTQWVTAAELSIL